MVLQTDYYDLGAGGMDALSALNTYLHDESPLESELLELVKARASLVNGCAHCAALHAERLMEMGEDETRLFVLGAWAESSRFTARERAALAWTDAVTRIPEGVSEDVHRQAHGEFGERELVDLTLAVGSINVYNRLAVCFREPETADA